MISAGLYAFHADDPSLPDDRLQRALRDFAPDLASQDLSLVRTKRGKPEFKRLSLHLSISHSGNFWIIGFCQIPLGIDVQDTRPARFEALARRFFHPDEVRYLEQNQFQDFYRIWTAKESYVKLTGTGIDSQFSRFSVLNLPVIFQEIAFQPGYVFTVCSEEPVAPILKYF